MSRVAWLWVPDATEDLHVAKITMPAMDNTPLHVLTLNARNNTFDVRTADGGVIDHGPANSLEEAKLKARASLWVALRVLADSYAI